MKLTSTPEFPYVATMSAPNLVATTMENAMRAAITGDYNAFKSAFKNFLLIEKTDDDCLCDNIDINARDYQYGYNLAHCAALGGNIDILKMVHEAGVSLDAIDKSGNTPLGSLRHYQKMLNDGMNDDIFPSIVSKMHSVNPEILGYLKNHCGKSDKTQNILKDCSTRVSEISEQYNSVMLNDNIR